MGQSECNPNRSTQVAGFVVAAIKTSPMSAVLVATANSQSPPPVSNGAAGLQAIVRPTDSLLPEMPVDRVADHMLDNRYSGLLSLPVVRNGRPLGAISRYQLMRIYLQRFGRELYGHRPIESLANRDALIVPVDTPIEVAARLIAERIASPITEDFIIVDDAGGYLGTGVVLDVLRAMDAHLAQRSSELERAYARVKTSQLQLVQSEKMASLGQMVAGLVHEINTPLGYVRNNVEMTRSTLVDAGRLLANYELIHRGLFGESDKPPKDLPQRLQEASELRSRVDDAAIADITELLNDSMHGLAQIGELIDNLKNFSRLDQGLMQKVNLYHLVASALRIVQHVMRKRDIEVICHSSEPVEVECAPAQINQVLLNLLNNAAQAIEHDHGRISVRMQVMGDRALILVEDNGKGISKQHLERIFDPFFTTKEIGKGTGLGLSIAHQIVTQHRGLLRVSSKPGVGTRFLLALPLHAPSEPS
jgi:two-component system, NtrC family, sensor kinase